MYHLNPTQPVSSGIDRRGSMAPAMMVALVVVISITALTLDRIWLQAAQTELMTAAEVAALGACRHLASDDLLRPDADDASRVSRARAAAVEIASGSQIAGQAVQLDGSDDGDIRFGRLLKQERTGRVVFVETPHSPTSVVVRAIHSRSRNNPVATFFHGLTGEDGADVASQAEATLDNQIPGFQPLDGAPIPILPIAILHSAPDGSRAESWKDCIEERSGRDDFAFNEETGEVTRGSDGIPEITLRLPGHDFAPDEINACVIVPQSRTTIPDLTRQFATGWNRDDLPEDDAQLRLDTGTRDFDTVTDVPGVITSELHGLVGQCRIVMLYKGDEGGDIKKRVSCQRFVAGRVMAILSRSGDCDIVFQPGVMTTRSAILADEADTEVPPEQLANAYIYKLRITQ